MFSLNYPVFLYTLQEFVGISFIVYRPAVAPLAVQAAIQCGLFYTLIIDLKSVYPPFRFCYAAPLKLKHPRSHMLPLIDVSRPTDTTLKHVEPVFLLNTY
jgi:hypothetical protein